jgi:two-component system alkaline phosphatase synthesis response regulator PhoP
LSPIEYRIFDLLLANQGRVVPYVTLLAYACGYTEGGMSTLLKSHVYHLRRKTGLSARSEDGLSAVPGAGYRLAEGARLAPPPGELVEGTAQSGRAVSRSSRSLPAAS